MKPSISTEVLRMALLPTSCSVYKNVMIIFKCNNIIFSILYLYFIVLLHHIENIIYIITITIIVCSTRRRQTHKHKEHM